MKLYLARSANSRYRPIALSLLTLCVVLLSAAAAADGDDPRARFRALMESVATNSFHAPVSVHSTEKGDVMTADVYGVVEHPFDAVADVIGDPRNVCDFVSLSINIKTCTYASKVVPTTMVWYMGRKNYSEPDPDQAVRYYYSVTSRSRENLQVRLHAPQSLLGITDNTLVIDVAAVDGHTLVHFSINYVGSLQSKLAMEAYLLTLGRNKIGFTTRPDAGGKPVPVKGAQGIIERNTMRYYLALLAYLDSAAIAPEQRDATRIARWYDYAERYPAQLHELPRDEYLDNKKRERLNQADLQQAIDAAAKSDELE